jgi:putative phage-type endonuclease
MTETKNRIIRLQYDPDNRDQWLEMRRRGIGGSDSAAIVGLNPYSSKLAVYADKLGLVPEREDNEAMREGRELEDYVAKRWEEKTGKKVQRLNAMLINEEFPWAIANLDRKVVGERSFLEIKTTSAWNKADFANGEIPPTYYCQVQHYLAVSGYEKAYLAVLVLNKAFYTFEIDRNEKEIDALMEAERIFWEEHVQKQVPPDPDGSESSMAVLDSKVFVDDTEFMPDAEGLFEQLERVQGMIKEYEDEKDALKQAIIARMGSRARGQAQSWTATYLPQERTTIDRAKLLKFYPQAYGDCAETKTTRTFRTKKNKGEK